MEKVLQLVFKKADGSKKVFSVTDPRDDMLLLTKQKQRWRQSLLPIFLQRTVSV